MRRISRNLAAMAMIVAAASLPAGQARASKATPPGTDGRIVYMRTDRAGHWQIWVASSSLSGAKQLTHGRFDSGWAVWSPNGKRLAFDSNRADHTPNNAEHVNDVFVMRAEGSGVKKLTNSKSASGDAAWSPNGRLIAFDSDRGSRKGYTSLYVMNANGRNVRRITKPAAPLSDYEPRFSPDGTHLVFSRARGTADQAPAAVFTIRLNGSGLHRLTSFALRAGATDWSPDGKSIVFEAYPNGPYGDIYTVAAAGGTPTNVTHDTTGQADPVWSPDGQKILFLDNGFVNGVGRTGLATMSPDGSNRHFISTKNVEAHQPDWESIPAAQLSAARKRPASAPRTRRDLRNGELTVFRYAGNTEAARIVTAGGSSKKVIWRCPGSVFCGVPVSFAWSPGGERVALTLTEFGGTSTYVGMHVVRANPWRDQRVPSGAPKTASITDDPAAWNAYYTKEVGYVGCGAATDLAWSPDGSRLAYECPSSSANGNTSSQINMLYLDGSAYHGTQYTTVPTGASAFWPTWSASATRIAFSTQLTPSRDSAVYTVALDGSHRRRIATGVAPAWSPDGKTIAYQTTCGIRLATPSGRDVTPTNNANPCGAIGVSGPPAWSPDGTKLAVEAQSGEIYVMDKSGKGLHRVSKRGSTTLYGTLPGRPSWRALHPHKN